MAGAPSFPKDSKIVAIADIGSASAGVCLAAIPHIGPALITTSYRAELPPEERTQEHTMTSVLTLLKDASEKVLKVYQEGKYGKKISSAYAVIHAPWARSKIGGATSAFQKEENISDGSISALAKQAFGNAPEVNNADVFEASVVSIELNGYPTGTPAKKRAHNVAISALISECDQGIRTGILETLQRTFSVSSPALRSGTRALLSVFHESPAEVHSHVLLYMEGEATNCLIMHRGVSPEHAFVPEGVHTILKRIAVQGMPQEALSLMRMAATDTCSTPACEALNQSLARVEPELVKIFGEAMAQLAAERRLPNELTLVVQSEFIPWLSKFFSRIDFSQFTITTQPFKVTAVAAEDMAPFAATIPGVFSDPGLIVAAGFVNAELQSA